MPTDTLTFNGRWRVRAQVQRQRTEAADRFLALTEQREAGEDLPCIVFTGGETFRVDDVTITTPMRFAYEMITGEAPPENRRIRRKCKTPGCVRLSHLKISKEGE
mgnify:CR=1 FL=1